MPRRNRNGRFRATDADQLAASIEQPAPAGAVADGKYPCAGCRRLGHWDGEYCALCKGAIVLSARRTTLIRR